MRKRIVRKRSGRRGVGASAPQRTMFGPPRYLKYSEIVRIDTPDAARGSVKILLREFENAETRAKKRKIKWMTVLAANRAAAARKRTKRPLSPREMREMMEVEKIYREAAAKMKLPSKNTQARKKWYLEIPNPDERAIIESLKETPGTVSDINISNELNISLPETRRILKKLEREGCVEFVGISPYSGQRLYKVTKAAKMLE